MPIIHCVDEFFEEVRPFNESPEYLIDGQIAWVPTLFHFPLPYVMKATRKAPRSHDEIKYDIRNMSSNDFQREKRLPIHQIDFQQTEELLVIKAKKRPCIMLSQTLINDDELIKATVNKKHLIEKEQIFLPIYSVETNDSFGSFPPRFVIKIRKLIFPHLMYLPNTDHSKNKKAFHNPLKEGIIRLDRIFSCVPHHEKITVTNIKISDEYFVLLVGCLKEYLLKENSEELKIVKDLCQE